MAYIEINIFNTSFLDLLSGALVAVIIIYLLAELKIMKINDQKVVIIIDY